MRPSALSGSDGVVVATERHRRLCCYQLATGEVVWDVGVGDAYGFLVVGQGVALYLDQSGTLTCFELEDGRRRWSVDGERLSGQLLLSESAVLSGGWRGYRPFGARHLETGDPLWRSDNYEPIDLHWPILEGGSVLVSARGSTAVDRIDPNSGEVLARLQVPEPVVSADNQAAFTRTPSGSVIFRVGSSSVAELDENGVALVWRGSSDLGDSGPPFMVAGKLWVPLLHGVAVLDPQLNASEFVVVQEGPAPGFGAVGSITVVASRAGAVLALDSDGARIAQLNISTRSSGLHQVSDDTAVIAIKGELVAVRFSSD